MFNREELVQTLFEESSDAYFLFEPASEQMVDVNPAVQRLTGYTRQELLRLPMSYLFRSETPGRTNQLRQAFSKTGLFYSQEGYLLRAKTDGVWIPVNVTMNRLHVRPTTLGLLTARDIREQRRTHADLKRAEAELRQVLSSIPDCIWSVELEPSLQAAKTYISPAVEKLTGRTAEFFSSGIEAWLSILHPEDRPDFSTALTHLQRGGASAIDCDHRVCWPNGEVRWLRNRVQASRGQDGLLRLAGVATDITEQQRAEQALHASEAKYRSLAENLEQCIFLKDGQLRFAAANRPFCQGLGRTEAEILGKNDFDFYPRELAEKYQADDRRILSEGLRLELEEQTLLGGVPRTVRVIKTPMKDAQGRNTGVLCIFWDVTEQRGLEAQLRQAQKMEAIGQLAGGIAHDFNNLLTVILGNVLLLKDGEINLADPDTAGVCPTARLQLLEATEAAAQQAAALTSKLLGFSRRTTLRLQPADLHACAREAQTLLRRTIDPRIEVEVRGVDHLWSVRADPSQMNQILMNLCLNARDAMPGGGRLVIETANVVLDEQFARLRVHARPGEYVRLRVEDTGEGMPQHVLQHIFEPFFTTKEPGKGTGLGLAMVFGIVQQHHGWIDCSTEVAKGTRFDIYLPRESAVRERPPSYHASLSTEALQPPCYRGAETILLVDDEPLIRNLGRTILESYGYAVLLAEDGQDALEIYAQQGEAIDLVILDLTMPRLSGRDAFRQLLQIDPNVRVLFASGYAAEQVADAGSDRVLGFVGKPYPPQELAQCVRTALDKNSRSKTRHQSSLQDRQEAAECDIMTLAVR
jgi:PAS domain S-box-containing protein